MAVASSIAAVSLSPSLSWGYSVDAATTGPSNILTESSGDTLIYPLYTVGEGGTTSSFSLTNTSNTEVVFTKIRFREQTHSMDAMDFIIVLSPNDKFDFTVSKPAGQRPKMTWNDTSCIVGPGQGSTEYSFPITNQDGKNNNSYVYDESALDAGHIEVLGMAGLTEADSLCVNANYSAITSCGGSGDINLATAATHTSSGSPANCAAVAAVMKSPSLVSDLQTAINALSAPASGDAPNSLTGRFVVTVPGKGIEAGGDALAIQNSDLPLSSQSQELCANSGNCVSTYMWDTRDYDHPHLGDMPNLPTDRLTNFQSGLAALNVAGDWSNNPANSVGVDWVMSFPTKYLYLSSLTNSATGVVAGYLQSQAVGDTKGVDSPYPRNGCLTADVGAWGVEEESGTTEEIVSPSPSSTLEFCNETNVLTFQVNGQTLRSSYLATLDSDGISRRTVVPFTVANSTPKRGWSYMGLNWASGSADSVGGVIFTTRDTDNATNNNSSMTAIQKGVGGVTKP